MFDKRTYIVFFIVGLLVAGSTFTFLYFWGDMQKKTPIRAKQVFYLKEITHDWLKQLQE
jgi:phosphotransferase system  glucose/maltose/N-acetylglucosamine-specific IIC component